MPTLAVLVDHQGTKDKITLRFQIEVNFFWYPVLISLFILITNTILPFISLVTEHTFSKLKM